MLGPPHADRLQAPLALLALVDSLPGSVAYWDRNLRCQFANRTYEVFFGLAPEKIVGMSMVDLLGEHLFAANREHIEGVLRGEPQAFEREVPSDGTTPRFVHARYVPDIADGVVRGFTVQVVDISARRDSELALQAREAELRAAQRLARMGTWRWNPITRRVDCSPEVYALLDIPPDALTTDEAWRALHAPGSFERAEAAALAAVQNHRAVDVDVELIPRPDGVRFLRVRGEPVLDDAGAVLGFHGVFMDVTSQREADAAHREREAQVLQLQKLDSLGRLAGGIAHDFNNMLMGILGNLEFALDALGDAQPDVEGALKDAIACANRSSELTRQILAFARRQPSAPRLVDLNNLVSEAMPMLRRLIGAAIELSWTPSPKAPLAHLDPSQLHQLLTNLVVNGRDAIDGGGRIDVSLECADLDAADCDAHPGAQPGPYVALVVCDTGAGMTPEVAARVFEPFFTTKGQGTGLGLSIVHGIVAQHGGHITLESHPGGGTRLKLWFPRMQERAANGPRPAPADTPRGRETLLVVEDEPAVRGILVTSLRRLGYTVHAVSNPAEAQAAARGRAPFGAVICDIVMPGLSGVDLVRALREDAPTLPCVFVTGYGDVDLESGDWRHTRLLRKPFDLRTLAGALRDLLDDSARRPAVTTAAGP